MVGRARGAVAVARVSRGGIHGLAGADLSGAIRRSGTHGVEPRDAWTDDARSMNVRRERLQQTDRISAAAVAPRPLGSLIYVTFRRLA